MRTSRVRAAAVVAGVAAVALAGCTIVHAPGRVAGRVAANPAKAVSASVRTPAGEAIPSAARAVTIVLTEILLAPSGTVTAVKEPQPVTVADPAKVRQIADLLNGLPPAPTGSFTCPSGNYRADLTLTFRAKTGSPVLAIVTAELADCAFTDVSIGGRRRPELGPGDGGRTLAAQALEIADLNWKIPG
ncbi:MAG TPA: hypothetical protein VHZ33_35840 [Trebonia sp.]|nr:hypothetical protein [Trebonia sp.]